MTAAGRPELRVTPADGFSGRDIVFTYRAEDTEGARSSDAAVRVHVNDGSTGNHAPRAYPDASQVVAGSSVTIPVLRNDVDDDNDVLAIDSVSIDGRDGSVTRRGANLVYRAPASVVGPVSFRYTMSDPFGSTSSATVLVNVLAPNRENQAPVALPDVATATPGRNELTPLVNDQDPDGDPLVITNALLASGEGLLQFNERAVFFTPAEGGPSPARVRYTISDGRGHSDSSTITITVRSSRLPGGPVARDDQETVDPGEVEFISVLDNDTDPNGDPLRVVSWTPCTPAECEATSDGRIRFKAPAQAGVGTISFAYTVENSTGQQSTATVRVTVGSPTASARSPIARSDTYTIAAGATETFDVLSNDDDPDGPTSDLRITKVSPAEPGTAKVSVTDDKRSLRLSVPSTLQGTVSFAYTIVDREGHDATAPVTVSITVPQGRPPIVVDRQIALDAGSGVDVDLLAGATDPDGDTDLRLAAPPTVTAGKDLITISPRTDGHTYRITALPGGAGRAIVSFDVADSTDRASSGQVIVTVQKVVNTAPVAAPDEQTTAANTSVDIAVLANDYDKESDPLTVQIARAPAAAQGRAEVLPGGQLIRFTPAPSFSGPATFTYQAVQPGGNESAPAPVTVKVAPCTDSVPTALPLDSFTPFDTPVSFTLLGPGQPGTLSWDGEIGGTVSRPRPGVLTFTPTPGNSGTGSFRYTISNSCGLGTSALATIDVNRAPRIGSGRFSTLAGTPLALTVDQLASDDETLAVTAARAVGGRVTIAPGGTGVVVSPTGAPGSTVDVTISVADPGGLAATGSFVVEVTGPANEAPSAEDDSRMISPAAATPIAVLANDRDPDGSPTALTVQLLSTSVVIGPHTVSLALSADRREVVATVPEGAHGFGTFTYRAVDGFGRESNVATVTLNVNRNPRNVGYETSVAAGSTVIFTVYDPGVYSDPDGDATVTDVTATTDRRVIVDFLPGLRIEVSVPPDVSPGDVFVTYGIYDYFNGLGVGRLVIHVTGGPIEPPPTTAVTTEIVPVPAETPTTAPGALPEPPPTDPAPTDPPRPARPRPARPRRPS